jgi:Flp pilus assembly pilin Flp
MQMKKANGKLKGFGRFLREEEGMGTVEVILIIVVLIGLVIIFKTQLRSLVETIFDKITKDSRTVMS